MLVACRLGRTRLHLDDLAGSLVVGAATITASPRSSREVSDELPTPATTHRIRHRALPWVLFALTLVVIAAVLALVLIPGGRVDAGPGDPSAEEPSSTADPSSRRRTRPTHLRTIRRMPRRRPDRCPSGAPPMIRHLDAGSRPLGLPLSGCPEAVPPRAGASPQPGSSARAGVELIALAVAPVPESVTTDSQLSDALSDVAIDAYAGAEAQWLELSSGLGDDRESRRRRARIRARYLPDPVTRRSARASTPPM